MPMQLSDTQRLMGKLLIQQDGHRALADNARWEAMSREHPELTEWPNESLRLYEELLFVSVESAMSSLYPICRKLFTRSEWHELAEEYRRTYPNLSYQLYMAVERFPDFVESKPALLERYPFLHDLALYEWTEVALMHDPKTLSIEEKHALLPMLPSGEASELSGLMPCCNPVSQLLTLQYDIPDLVEQIQESDFTESSQQQENTVLLYRDPETHSVRFFKLNVLTAKLLQKALQQKSYALIFQEMKTQLPELANVPLQTVITEGLKFFTQCWQNNILLGSIGVNSVA